MRIGFLRRTGLVFSLLIALGSSFYARGQGEGIFAEFNTSMGSFTCRLEYASSPKAVANFIGLATGQRAWLDQNTGAVKNEPYYDGLTFHRVIQGFVIQSGSRNGQGTDGPGYAFLDEFTNSLRYTTTGVLGMANSGTNSNGAQFFITVGSQATLNDHYTIFGELTGGTNVLLDINRVSTDPFSDKPTSDIMLQSVVIRPVGAQAQAFDINAQGLPVVTSQRLSIAANSSNLVSLTFSNHPYAENFLFSSLGDMYVPATFTNVYVTTNFFVTNSAVVTNYMTNIVGGVTNITSTNVNVTNVTLTSLYATNIYATNLATWFSQSLGIEVPNAPITNTFYRVRNQDRSFFKLAQINYPPIYVPQSINNRTLALNFDNGQGSIVINFNGSGGGTYTSPGDPPGTIKNYGWSQTYYQGDLDPITYSLILPMSLSLFFNSPSNGIFNGTVNSSGSYTVTGTFILSPGN
jgi:cyclophilin family peptidyl-prolyl cis-trans isomerase